ncbi:MAG: hypothetical protein H0V96_10640 [Acidimicrobiia bacterium]|nr:hypothetical protein [Acidimicrobiia bacterium]
MTDADDFAPPPGSDPPPPLPPAATGEPDAKGFVGALFDYSFSRSATPKIARVLYVLISIGIVVGYLAVVSPLHTGLVRVSGRSCC